MNFRDPPGGMLSLGGPDLYICFGSLQQLQNKRKIIFYTFMIFSPSLCVCVCLGIYHMCVLMRCKLRL